MFQAVFVYWSTNNALSIVQTLVLKQEGIRKLLDIPKPPPAEEQVPLRMKNPFTAVAQVCVYVRLCSTKRIGKS
jgi:membrane protein insertase Oxa1/YidC/SpoIIIJ